MYKVEVTGHTTAELAGKMMALAIAMNGNAAEAPTPVAAPTADPKITTSRKKADKVAEAPQSEPVAEAPAETTESAPAEAPQPEPAAAEPLNFDRDVAPLVIRAVKERGKPWVADFLQSNFGVERASLVDDARMPELVAKVTEALA